MNDHENDHSDDEHESDGRDAARGKFVWNHPDVGTIYADTEDDAIGIAKRELDKSDPERAGTSCVNVTRLGFNDTPRDWKPDAA